MWTHRHPTSGPVAVDNDMLLIECHWAWHGEIVSHWLFGRHVTEHDDGCVKNKQKERLSCLPLEVIENGKVIYLQAMGME